MTGVDVSKSERNIVNNFFSQINSLDVPENTITELKDEENNKPSVTEKIASYFYIYECGRNLLDRLDVNHISRIDTLGVNEEIWSVIDTTSNVLSGTDNVKKFDTIVQRSMTQETNMESLGIEERSLKSIFPELGTKLDSSIQVNLANSVVRESPKFKNLRHPTIETADIRNLDYISATRPKN